jgi:hypothetical protein
VSTGQEKQATQPIKSVLDSSLIAMNLQKALPASIPVNRNQTWLDTLTILDTTEDVVTKFD